MSLSPGILGVGLSASELRPSAPPPLPASASADPAEWLDLRWKASFPEVRPCAAATSKSKECISLKAASVQKTRYPISRR
jgi:hypothetical protein